MLLRGEKSRTVEATAACLGPPDQPVLWISCKKNNLAWGCKLIQDYPWKHQISTVVSSLLPKHRGTYFKSKSSMKTAQHGLLQRVKPLSSSGHFPSSCLSLWHSERDGPRTGAGTRLCQCSVGDTEQEICSSPCLARAPCPSWVTDLSNCIICLINISPLPLSLAFFQPVCHSWLCWPGLFGGTSWPSPPPAPASILRI